MAQDHRAAALEQEEEKQFEMHRSQTIRPRTMSAQIDLATSMNSEADLARQQVEILEERMKQYLEDIRMRVLNEFNIDVNKWSAILQDFVWRAITETRP